MIIITSLRLSGPRSSYELGNLTALRLALGQIVHMRRVLCILMIITTITSLGLALGQIIDSRQREGERTFAKWVCLAPGEVFFLKAFHECPLSDLVNLQKR